MKKRIVNNQVGLWYSLEKYINVNLFHLDEVNVLSWIESESYWEMLKELSK